MNKPLKWKKFIERAEKKGYFSRRARQRVQDWPTCAIGEHEALIATNSFGDQFFLREAAGPTLETLGVVFMKKVLNDQVYTARRVYNRIQRICRERGI